MTDPDRGSFGTDPADEMVAAGFPEGFLWGAATSAYQVDGAAAEDGRTPSIWDTFSRKPGAVVHGDTGDIACDHYHRWRADIDLMAGLNLGAYRLSISWPRLQPKGRGDLNPAGVSVYRSLFETLREQRIHPFVTLYHWELPQELEDAGGWPSRDTAARFADFAALAVDALGDLASDWITLNEPWCQAFLGYGSGVHAPGRRDLSAAVAAAHHLNLAHGLAVRSIRAQRSGLSIGPANIVTDVVAASDRPEDVEATLRYDANSNVLFLDPVVRGAYPASIHALYDRHGLADLVKAGDEAAIAAPIDFLAINHYQRVIVSADPADLHLGANGTPAEPATTSLGWSVIPAAFRNVLVRVHGDYPSLPLYVTENGASYVDYVDPSGEIRDYERVDYLRGYLGAAAEALAAGVDLRGYFAWSLMDNFEWGEGYRSRFGLIYVDYATQRRIPKASAGWYRDFISHHRGVAGTSRQTDRDGRTASNAGPSKRER